MQAWILCNSLGLQQSWMGRTDLKDVTAVTYMTVPRLGSADQQIQTARIIILLIHDQAEIILSTAYSTQATANVYQVKMMIIP